MSAAPVVIKTLIFNPSCIIRMAGTHLCLQELIITGMLIPVRNKGAQRRASGMSFKNTALQHKSIGLLAGGTQLIPAWRPAFQLVVQKLCFHL